MLQVSDLVFKGKDMRYVIAATMFVFAWNMLTVAKEPELVEPYIKSGLIRTQSTGLPRIEGLRFTAETYPKTSGSTSAEPLGVWVACRLLKKQCTWQMQGERRLFPVKTDEDSPESRDRIIDIDREFYRRISHYGTHGSYQKLINNEVDLIYECRLPSEDERNLMDNLDVSLQFTPVALDAFVFLRHKDNPVTGLSMEQVRDIYTKADKNRGKIENWKLVGGPDRVINAYVRNRNSGSQETMESLVMKGRDITGGRSMTGMSMMGPYNLLHRDVAGIGFTFFYYQRYMAPQDTLKSRSFLSKKKSGKSTESLVKMLAIDGVAPCRETIANGSYPLVTKVYAVTRRDMDPKHSAMKLLNWLTTVEGQKVISETGYVSCKFRNP